MGWRSFSEAICLEEVPEATSEWNPEQAPQATVMNRVGTMKFWRFASLPPNAWNAGSAKLTLLLKLEIRTPIMASADEYDPEGTACSKTELQSEEQESKDADDTDYRSRNDSEAGAVCEETVYYSQDYEEHGYNCGRLISGRLCYDACTVRHERSGDDVYEGRNDEHENEQSEDQEQLMGSLAHGVADNIADGFAAMTYRGEECAPVMKAADENATQDTPQENGDPAVDGSLYRAVDRACACDGGEVVPHKYRGLGSDIVDAISHGDCRGLS